MDSKIIIALDVDTLVEAEKVIRDTKDYAAFYKIHTLYNKYGKDAIALIKKYDAKTFLDLKFHDIPNTVGLYAQNMVELGVDMFNLHTSGGLEMMKAAVIAAEERALELGKKKPIIIGVTILTSIDQEAFNKELRVDGDIKEQVKHLAILAKKAGVDGVVCSPHEIDIVRRSCGDDFLIVTPGIRQLFSQQNDQKRTMTPKEAISLGANYLVIGRPITQADDKKKACEMIMSELG